MAAIDAFNDRLHAQGYWVYANGLAEPSTATVAVVDPVAGRTP
jgi:hypothetical protein